MERSDYHAVAASIENGKSKALIAAGVVKWAEPDQSDMPHYARHQCGNSLMLGTHAIDGGRGRAHRGEVLCQHSHGVVAGEPAERIVDTAFELPVAHLKAQHEESKRNYGAGEYQDDRTWVAIKTRCN
jgi:hypothetical protein